jgi:acetolactate synthase I/II/III large subunit
MKLADYVLDFIISLGVKDVFGLVGGTIGVLADRLREYQIQDKLCFVHVNDERSAAMATEGYARENGFGVCLVGGGPGVSNLITGVLGAFQDSIPCLFIAGQSDQQIIYRDYGKNIFKDKRQSGTQEAPHVLMMEPVTKYSVLIERPEDIRYHLEKAVWIAMCGRPGPVFIDIPKDMQKIEIDPDQLRKFDLFNYNDVPNEESGKNIAHGLEEKTKELINMINQAHRPVILFGGGVRRSGTIVEAKKFAEDLGAPVVLSWGGLDAFPHDHPAFVGTLGDYGTRAANFTVQNCDLLISIGSWLSPRNTTMDFWNFARGAKIAMIDISESELKKEFSKSGGRHIDLPIRASLPSFFFIFDFYKSRYWLKQADISEWRDWVKKEYKEKYPPVMESDFEIKNNVVNPRFFMHRLSEILPQDARIVGDCGTNGILMMTCLKVKEGQRAFANCGTGSIGSSLPMAFGVSYALRKKPVICIMGDGGIQQTIGLLENIRHQQIPIKIFVLNNKEYGLMSNTQRKSYGGRYIGTTTEPGGYSSPDLTKVAEAFGIKAFVIDSFAHVCDGIKEALDFKGPILVEVKIPKEFGFLFVNYGDPLEDSRIDIVAESGIVSKYLSVEDMRRAMHFVPPLAKTLAREKK